MSKIKVAILLDRENKWIKKYIAALNQIKDLNARYSFIFFESCKGVKGFELVFILGYTKILPREFLKRNHLNLIIHESNLPKGKGFSPVQRQILEGKRRIPICLFEALDSPDSGDILKKDFFKLSGHELLGEIRKKQALASISLIKKFLNKYPAFARKKQEGKSTFYRKMTHKDDQIDINKTIKEEFNHFRIANNEEHPLHFTIKGHKYFLKIYK